jgi:hypothetical protein
VGWFGPNRPERLDERISKETTWAIKVNRAKMMNGIETPAEMAFKFKQGFWIQNSKIQILLN